MLCLISSIHVRCGLPLGRLTFLRYSTSATGPTLVMCPLAHAFLGCRATTIHFLLARGASDFHFGGKHVGPTLLFPLIYPVRVSLDRVGIRNLPPQLGTMNSPNRPYSRRGHDGQKERLGLQIYHKFARQYVNCDATPLLLQVPVT